MSELWRVEVGAYTTGDHYAVGPDGSWHMAGTTQDARALVAYLNGLEQRLHDAEAQRDQAVALLRRSLGALGNTIAYCREDTEEWREGAAEAVIFEGVEFLTALRATSAPKENK